jgi:hypothetical protein
MTPIMEAKSEADLAAFEESHAALQSLYNLIRQYGIPGVNVWLAVDDEYDIPTITVEAGAKHTSGSSLSHVLLKADGRLPTRRCMARTHKGPRELPVSHFSRRADRQDGFHYYCNACNREHVKRSGAKRREKQIAKPDTSRIAQAA